MHILRSLLLLCLLPGPALAVDAITSASPRVHAPGEAATWVVGRGFMAGLMVSFSGEGLSVVGTPRVVPQGERIDGGLGDGLELHFSIAPGAAPGPRTVTFTAPDGRQVTAIGLIEVLASVSPDAGPLDGGPPLDAGAPQDAGLVPDAAVVDGLTRASPSVAEQGAGLNLWLVGQGLADGAVVSFSNPGLSPVVLAGAPLSPRVVLSAPSEGRRADGVAALLRVASDAPLGPLAVTVTLPDGRTLSQPDLLTVVGPGEGPRPGLGSVDALTGASPRALRVGQPTAVWLWGEGFEPGAALSWSASGISAYAPITVVKDAVSHRGDGLMAFLQVAEDAPPGAVNLTLTNPNGTQVTRLRLIELVPPASLDENGAVDPTGACPALTTDLRAFSSVSPSEVMRGETVTLTLTGQGITCGAAVVIPGEGLTPQGPPTLMHTAAGTTLSLTVTVDEDAPLGAREVTLLNPNNTAKTLEDAFAVVDVPVGHGVSPCTARPGQGGGGWALFLVALLALRRRG